MKGTTWSGLSSRELLAQWDEFFEGDAPEKLARYLVQTCVLRTLQLVDMQDSQAVLLIEHFQTLSLDENLYLVSTVIIIVECRFYK